MKIHRQSPQVQATGVKPAHRHLASRSCLLLCLAAIAFGANGLAGAADSTNKSADATPNPRPSSNPDATALLERVLFDIAHGPAFDAKVRQTVWTSDREVVGVGTYEQAGGGTGRFNLQITMHDGDGKHRLQQISDGRLAWTRSEIAGRVSLTRVDVGRLDHRSGDSRQLSPRLKIGGWTELLDTLGRDYVISVAAAKLNGQPVAVITGQLRQEVRSRTMSESGRETWPVLCPTQARVVISSIADEQTGFTMLLPTHFQFWSDPLPATERSTPKRSSGRPISSIEIYSIRAIAPPPIERFRFDNRDAEVNFVNETDRYIERLK